jgi:hypothetical protein
MRLSAQIYFAAVMAKLAELSEFRSGKRPLYGYITDAFQNAVCQEVF